MPREIGGVLWFGNDDANMVAFTPIYCSSTVRPECYNTPGADAVNFSFKNAYWVCNMTSNMVYPRYSQMFPTLKEVRDSLDNSYFAAQPGVEAKAQELYAQNPQAAVKYLNDYGIEKAQQMLARWQQLFQFMVVKYNDMIIKPTKKMAVSRRLLMDWVQLLFVLGILRNMPRNLLSKQETSSWFLKQSNNIYHHIKKADSSILLYKNRLSCFLDLQY